MSDSVDSSCSEEEETVEYGYAPLTMGDEDDEEEDDEQDDKNEKCQEREAEGEKKREGGEKKERVEMHEDFHLLEESERGEKEDEVSDGIDGREKLEGVKEGAEGKGASTKRKRKEYFFTVSKRD